MAEEAVIKKKQVIEMIQKNNFKVDRKNNVLLKNKRTRKKREKIRRRKMNQS